MATNSHSILTLNQQFSGRSSTPTTVGSSHRIGPRILREGLSDKKTVKVAVLLDLEVRWALDLSALSVELHDWLRDSCNPHVQSHLAALAHCRALQPLKEARWRSLRYRGHSGYLSVIRLFATDYGQETDQSCRTMIWLQTVINFLKSKKERKKDDQELKRERRTYKGEEPKGFGGLVCAGCCCCYWSPWSHLWPAVLRCWWPVQLHW